MPATITIVTPENVEITYEVAGLGSRGLAALVDNLIHGFVFLGLFVAATFLTGVGQGLGVKIPEVLQPWLAAAAIILIFGLFWGYYIFFETRWAGQTPGKRVVGLRVLRDGGYPIDFRAAVIRNLMRYVDFLPWAYGVGVVSIFCSRDYKRLGDFVAGTIVVHEGKRGRRGDRATGRRGDGIGGMGSTPSTPSFAPSPDRPDHLAPLGGAPPSHSTADLPPFEVAAVSRADYQAVRHYLDRREFLPATARERLAEKLAAPFRTRLTWFEGAPPADANAFLELIAHWYERRHGT